MIPLWVFGLILLLYFLGHYLWSLAELRQENRKLARRQDYHLEMLFQLNRRLQQLESQHREPGSGAYTHMKEKP